MEKCMFRKLIKGRLVFWGVGWRWWTKGYLSNSTQEFSESDYALLYAQVLAWSYSCAWY